MHQHSLYNHFKLCNYFLLNNANNGLPMTCNTFWKQQIMSFSNFFSFALYFKKKKNRESEQRNTDNCQSPIDSPNVLSMFLMNRNVHPLSAWGQ